jgi:hypothetical protein
MRASLNFVSKEASLSDGTKPFSEGDENVRKQKAPYPRYQQNGDAQHAIHLRYDLEPVTQQFPRLHGPARGSVMIEASAAILALISLAIFAAHALDAYRTG